MLCFKNPENLSFLFRRSSSRSSGNVVVVVDGVDEIAGNEGGLE
jgi:hypothetical protein